VVVFKAAKKIGRNHSFDPKDFARHGVLTDEPSAFRQLYRQNQRKGEGEAQCSFPWKKSPK
jgi:hypothetical protein